MKTLDNLRQFLVKHNDFLADNPTALHLFIENGSVEVAGGASSAFFYKHTLTIIITDYPGSFDALTIPLLAWLLSC